MSKKEKKNTNRTEEERLEQVTLIKAKLNEYQLDERYPDIDQSTKWFDIETHTTANVVLHTTKTYIKQCNAGPNTVLGKFVSFVSGDRYNGSKYAFVNATINCPPGDVMGHITMVTEYLV